MKLPDIYTDWKIVVGLGLIMLGAANWIIGVERTQIYSRMIVAHQQPSAATDYRSFDELDAGAGGASSSRSRHSSGRRRTRRRGWISITPHSWRAA